MKAIMGKFRTKSGCLEAFLLSLIMAMVVFIPFIIYGKGYFVYYIDFNVQQLPFYQMCHDAVRSGDIFWNWQTDLGANFIGSYSFYLLGSPFFWLTLPFPSDWVPHLMAPLLMLKTACCGLTSYLYLKRFVRRRKWALLGSVLYAFCGFNACNIVFNHFHEAVVIFPLMLVAMEEFMQNGRRGWFALSVCAAAVINYFFFAGQAMFLVIYFCVRSFSKDFGFTWKKFGLLAFEAVVGTLMACFILLPSALAVADNPRMDYSLWGMHIFMYSRVQRYFLILQGMFFPADNIMMPNLFQDSDAHFSSVSLYLPLFSMVGVAAFWNRFRQTWLKRLLMICLVMAMVPALNSFFFAFNGSYYARWFYMPTLMMALATVIALEHRDVSLRDGLLFTGLGILFFVWMGIAPTYVEEELKWFAMPKDPARYWGQMAFGIVGWLLVAGLELGWGRRLGSFYQRCMAGTVVMSIAFTIVTVAIGTSGGASNEWDLTVKQGIYGGERIQLDDSQFFRIDTVGLKDNMNMWWDFSSMECFHSVVPGSIMSYYDAIGYDRGVGSRAEPSYNGVRGLTSVRYLFCTDEKEEEVAQMYGFSKRTNQNGYNVYENDYFIPMGFTYDQCMTEETLETYNTGSRDKVMLGALVLAEEDCAKYQDLLELAGENEIDTSEEGYLANCEARRAESGYDFSYDKHGFTSRIQLEEDNLVFYSVPWEAGWSVTVNGEPAEVVRANIGFMAVKAPAGDNEIRFTYKTPGLSTGIWISLGGTLVLLFYLWGVQLLRKRYPRTFRVKRGDPGSWREFYDEQDQLR
ncbi:MAG: YfhO family protein [Eubacteriales bacterium]|jgi:uncharacterized membrane protein YfhO